MNKLITFLFLILVLFSSSCVTIAPPPPMATMGGPGTTPKSSSEMALAVGTGAALFKGAHTGSQGWFARYKYGLSDKVDIGMDWTGANGNNGLYLGAKFATRYQLAKNHRVELGLGAGDHSSGKSLNGDIAYTMGTTKNPIWNYYTSARLAYAHGYPGNAILADEFSGGDTLVPPNTFITLINVGAQAKISDNQRFIFEGGYGRIFPAGERSGPVIFLSAGVLITLDRAHVQ